MNRSSERVGVVSVIAGMAVRNGGPPVKLAESVSHLQGVGVDITVVTTDIAGPAGARPFRRITAEDLPSHIQSRVRIAPVTHPKRLVRAPALKRLIREELATADVLRVHGLYLAPSIVGMKEAQRADMPYIVTPHGSLDPTLEAYGRLHKRPFALLQDRLVAGANAIQATSEREAHYLTKRYPTTRVEIIPNGFDLAKPLATSRRALARPTILFLGRITVKKRIEVLIEALPLLDDRWPEAQLRVVGPDDEGLVRRLTALAERLGVRDRVSFEPPAWGDARYAVLSEANVWALPSVSENFGNAMVEALACGCPCVVSDQLDLAPSLAAAEAAAVVPPDAENFAAALRAVLEDGEMQVMLGRSGRQFASTFSWPRVAQELRGMFERVRDTHRVRHHDGN